MKSLSILLLLLISTTLSIPTGFAANTVSCPPTVNYGNLGATDNFSAPTGWYKSQPTVSEHITLPRNSHYVISQGKRMVCTYGKVNTDRGTHQVASINKPFPANNTCKAISCRCFQLYGRSPVLPTSHLYHL